MVNGNDNVGGFVTVLLAPYIKKWGLEINWERTDDNATDICKVQ